jgi:hypothetical protein
MFCDGCGHKFSRKESVCPDCQAAPAQHWLQLIGLAMLLAAVGANALVGHFLLPRMAISHRTGFFRAWLWFDLKASIYGWVPITAGLLAWDYFVWVGERPKVKGWATRKLLTFTLASAVAPMLPWWVPAGQPPGQFLDMIGKHPGVPAALAWGSIVLVTLLLCTNAETRNRLLGRGPTLGLVGLSSLLLVFGMALAGWAMS